jgi:hypothetical protein
MRRFCFISLASLGLLFLASPVVAQDHLAIECPEIRGQFLVRGERAESDHLHATVYYLDQFNEGLSKREGHYFLFDFLPDTREANVIFFTARDHKLFRQSTYLDYHCEDGTFVNYSEIEGGVDSCSQHGTIKRSLSLGSNGALQFISDEVWEFGLFCFKKSLKIHRVVSFSTYVGATK